MKKKLWALIVAAVLVVGLVLGLVFGLRDDDSSSETNYNIIFTNATVPPTLAAMDSILDGGPTYAYIQRGKTYAGIGELTTQNFSNYGFDVSNQENLLSPTKVQDFVNLVKRLKTQNKHAKFNIYVTDYNAYAGFAIGIYAKLDDSDYKVVMIEDGGGFYSNFTSYFITGKTIGGVLINLTKLLRKLWKLLRKYLKT